MLPQPDYKVFSRAGLHETWSMMTTIQQECLGSDGVSRETIWTPPARFLHRDTPAPLAAWIMGEVDNPFRRWFGAHAIDCFATGLARPVCTPIACARAGFDKGMQAPAPANVIAAPLAGVAGAIFGLGKGCLGGAMMGMLGIAYTGGVLVEVVAMPPLILLAFNTFFQEEIKPAARPLLGEAEMNVTDVTSRGLDRSRSRLSNSRGQLAIKNLSGS